MDPLSVTASVIAVLQATEAVISVCCDYRSAVKGSSWEVPQVLEEVRGLRNVLRILEKLADEAETSGSTEESRLPALRSLCDPDTGILSRCRTELEKLKTKLTPPEWSGPAGSKRRGLVEALSWPLKKGDTEKVLVSIERLKSTISLAVAADQTNSVKTIADTTEHIQTCLSSMIIDAHQQEVRKWLHGMDPSPKYIRALQDRQEGTGSWLTNSEVFSDWVTGPNSLVWLHGIPGCGKTVLCSTAIEWVRNQRNTAVEGVIAVGYFYFQFDDQEKQRCGTMLRSLIAQLSLQGGKAHKPLDALYSDCNRGESQPSLLMLLNTLRDTVESFTNVVISLDALDECKEREEMAKIMEQIAGWEIAGLHMLVTSRREKDIEEVLSALLEDKHKICIESAVVEGDIRAYVQSHIRTDRKLKKWREPKVQAEIETVLVEKAGGMFQWVKCQLDALGRCLSLSDLRKALRSLPKDLDDTYARILQSIDNEGYGEHVAKIMQWLAYSNRPMSLVEFGEVITIDVEGDPEVDVERRLGDPQDLLTICSSLVSTVYQRVDGEVKETLQFAHFSVREYLGSPRLHDGKFAVQEIRANTFIAESCIVYFRQLDQLYTNLEECSVPEISKRYPLAEYAATYWSQHARDAGESGNIISRSKEFFQSEGYALPIWLKLSERDSPELIDAQGKRVPLHFASALDLPKTMRELILAGADVNSRSSRSGRTPLMAVSYKGRDYAEVVQLLLEHGAEVNLRDRSGDNALILASFHGSVHTVQTLLDNGADINAENKRGFTALVRAAQGSHPEILQRLLDRGASINSPYGGDKVLAFSSSIGDYESVKTLLDRGVNVNAEVGPSFIDHLDAPFSTALLQALSNGHNDIAELLIEYGADVNARSTVEGEYGIALDHALTHGSHNMVKFLLANGAVSSYEELHSEVESARRSLLVPEEEAKEPQADL